MRFTFALTALLGALTLVPVQGLAAEKMTGLIAFADCAEDGKVTEAEHAKCAAGKNRDDQVLVFVPEKTPKKVLELLFEDEADPYVGKLVVIEGVVEDNFLEIHKIAAKK